MEKENAKQKKTKEKAANAVPDDQSNIRVDSFIKIFDPESKKVYLETRA